MRDEYLEKKDTCKASKDELCVWRGPEAKDDLSIVCFIKMSHPVNLQRMRSHMVHYDFYDRRGGINTLETGYQ